MNTLTHSTGSHAFAAVTELLALPLVRAFTDRVTHLAYGDKTLLAFNGKYMSVVGRFAEPVRLPREVARTSQLDQGAKHE